MSSLRARSSATAPGILLGHKLPASRSPMGFNPPSTPTLKTSSLIEDTSDSHTLIIAPTGMGKGRSLIIPNLLHWPGSAICVDPKGEAAMVTARWRRQMGQQIHILDPFDELRGGTAQFDPLCRLKAGSRFIIDDAFACASLLSAGSRSAKEPFWDNLSEALEAGLLVHAATAEGETDRSLGRVYDILTADDMVYQLACMLDKKEVTHAFSYRQISAFLQHEGEKVRTSVRSTAQQHMKIFASDAVRHAVGTTTFDIEDLKAGKPMTIYIVVPPKYLVSHGPIVRLWLSTLIDVITDRRQAPELPTLFIVDEMHALGPMPLLKQVVTLLRGYGLRAMMVLQNRQQLNELFPDDASTLVTNCDIVTFGHRNMAMSHDLAGIIGDMSAKELFGMDRDMLAIQRACQPTEIARKLDYVTDPMFRGRFDPNSFVSKQSSTSEGR